MTQTVSGIGYAKMIAGGAANLRAHVKEINDLNVFPIPDGDTGDNMLMTIRGGAEITCQETDALDEIARRVSGGMLLSARGNSGVILSQFFQGITNGFSGCAEADVSVIGEAFRSGVSQAYRAVIQPEEGTILTVVREATEYACLRHTESIEDFLLAFLQEARLSLARTPELLSVLKKAGVVDSGGAGLIYIIEGMLRALSGEEFVLEVEPSADKEQPLALDAFSEDSVLEFGYCTELLLRLQRVKVSIADFHITTLTDALGRLGNSVVAVHDGSLVKLHVHTKTPDRVLAICQQYGEFLKVKIENMSLQHNHIMASEKTTAPKTRKQYGVVAVAAGEGLKQLFLDCGADRIVDGGQSMNPSVEAFIEAFDEIGADTIFVLPNNSNIVLTAKQAADMYQEATVHVIESRTVGEGYAALSMYDTGAGDADAIAAALREAMQGVVTAEISHCVRDALIADTALHAGDYIGFVGKQLLAMDGERYTAACRTLENLPVMQYDICLLIYGKDVPAEEAARLEAYFRAQYKNKEVYIINGGQDVYDYLAILE